MIKQFLYSAILIACLAGCQSKLLDTQPYDKISEEQFWKTQQHALMGVNAIYNNLLQEQVYGEYYMLDCLSPIAYGYDRLEAEMAGTTTAYSSTYADKWSQLYKGVQLANNALAHLPEMQINTGLRDRLIGEAKFLRALHYFNLLDFFGGVPLYDKPVEYAEAMLPRSSAQEVREFIRKDLTDAIALLPATYGAADFGRATKGAAMALRGKLALYAGEWAAAEEDLRAVMALQQYSLHPVYSQLFRAETEKNSEVIFSIQYIAVQNYGENMSFRLGTRATTGSCWTNGVPSPNLVDAYEMLDGSPFDWDKVVPGFSSMTPAQKDQVFRNKDLVKPAYENRDPRLQATIIVPYAQYVGANNVTFTLAWPFVSDAAPQYHIRHNWNANALYVWRKFVSVGTESQMREDGPIDFPVIRYADVLLMFAEAHNELAGPDVEVLDAINRVRLRAGVPALQQTDPAAPTYVAGQDAMRQRIRHERAVEFATEGMYYSDVRRWRIAEQVCNEPILEFTGKTLKTRVFLPRDYLWPIPQAEREQNAALEQNPGWD